MTQRVDETNQNKQHLIFVYGTLKLGFPNHGLIQTLISSGDATFIGGDYLTVDKLPLVSGPYGVPFLLNLPHSAGSHRVRGELYAVSDQGLIPLDELEGIALGHYERLPIKLIRDGDAVVVEAEAYFGHRSFAEEMWRRSGELGFPDYSEEWGKGYVARGMRSGERSFLEAIRLFVSSSSL